MIHFTSDWHLGEDRIGVDGKPNVYYRPFKSIREQDETIIGNFINNFKDGDVLYHLGDVVYKDLDNAKFYLDQIKESFPNSEFNLVVGNYDEDKIDFLEGYFELYHDMAITDGKTSLYLDHYPSRCLKALENNNQLNLGICGHIHGLWKVQEKLVNVGVDAWHFNPVSQDELSFCLNAMINFYDEDVFPCEK